MTIQITICGGGNAAHTLAGILAAQPANRVNVYLSLQAELIQWKEGIQAQGGIVVRRGQSQIIGRPERISAEPADAVPGAQLILLALPAFAHESVLQEITPYLDQGAWIGALPARGCFDLCARMVLGERYAEMVIFGLQTLPWACRVQRYGREAIILGTKASVDLAAWPAERGGEMASILGNLLNLDLKSISSFLSLTLAGTGQLIHPGIMYGLFHHWDGEPFVEAPLFYQGIDASTADFLQALSDEVQSIRRRLVEISPDLDLSAVRPLAEWLRHSYENDIADRSSLQAALVTNRGYAGLKAPMRSQDGGLYPDFQARYLSEDVPYALVATRGIAELAGVPTPTMERVITWAQDKLGKEYLVAGSLRGRDVSDSRAPQRFGIDTLENLFACYTVMVDT